MPADLENSKDQRSMAAWFSKADSLLSRGEELAMQKTIAEATMAKSQPTVVPRKACICAPTNHAGSFRCHLHRITTKKPLQAVEDKKSSMSKAELGDGKTRLSRFGRTASARNSQKS